MNEIKQLRRLPLVDVHSREITPAIYMLLFAVVELTGNDTIYDIDPWEWDEEYGQKEWDERLSRGSSNCYFDHKKMEEFCANPCTYVQAIEQFKQWLLDRGVKDGEEVLAKIWW